LVNTLSSKPGNQYKIDFKKIDNPVEVLMLPIMRPDISLSLNKNENESLKGSVNAQQDSFSFSMQKTKHHDPKGKTAGAPATLDFTHGKVRKQHTQVKGQPGSHRWIAEIPGFFNVEQIDPAMKLEGNINDSEVKLNSFNEGEDWKVFYKGTIGDMKVDTMFERSNEPEQPFIAAKGQIGGLDYEEDFYLSGENGLTSSGHLGDMEIKTDLVLEEDNGVISEEVHGQIGNYSFTQKAKENSEKDDDIELSPRKNH